MDRELDPLLRVLQPIRSYLPYVVVVGGWVPILYRHCLPEASPADPLGTRDVDLAAPLSLPVRGMTLDRLLTRAGFVPELSPEGPPHCRKYVSGDNLQIDILAPMRGDGSQRVVQVQRDLPAQALRYVEVLLEHTTTLVLPSTRLRVRVPELAAFFFQKGLACRERGSSAKQEKDFYYMYEILDSVPEGAPGMAEKVIKIGRDHPAGWMSRFRGNLSKAFVAADAAGVLGVVRQASARARREASPDVLRLRVFGLLQEFLRALTKRR